jgi:hypothetical protein
VARTREWNRCGIPPASGGCPSCATRSATNSSTFPAWSSADRAAYRTTRRGPQRAARGVRGEWLDRQRRYVPDRPGGLGSSSTQASVVLSFVGGMTDPPPLPYRFPGHPRRREDARGMSDGQAEGKTSPALVPARDARAIVEAVRVLRAHSLRRGEGAAPGRRPRSCSSLNAGRHDGCIRIEPCG